MHGVLSTASVVLQLQALHQRTSVRAAISQHRQLKKEMEE